MSNSANKNRIDPETYTHQKFKDLVDKSCPSKFCGNVHIHVHDMHLMWGTLNQTDLETNSNKYFVIQLLKHDTMNSFFLISRSGRIGYENKKDLKCFLNEDKAISEFCQLFYEKTGYLWSDRFQMVKKDGKYDYMDMDIGLGNDSESTNKNKDEEAVEVSQRLHPLVEKLIQMIYDVKMFQSTMDKLKIDSSRAPLGKISQSQINKAFGILTQIQDLIKENVDSNDKRYLSLSSAFYTLIPTSHGNQKLPLLMSDDQIKEKSALLEVLGEMGIVSNIMGQLSGSNQLSQKYSLLNAEIKPLTDLTMTGIIQKYLIQTWGQTHHMRLKIQTIYEVNRAGEKERFEKWKPIGNRQLLWHGSRLSNIVGILSSGLKIAPPEAPSTGYMFGKGIYFANAVSKSANYMHIGSNGSGVILLCEVALGQTNQKKNAEYITKLPDGLNSTWGMGQNTPNIKDTAILDDGLIVPFGRLEQSNRSGLSLVYDEFIVYDVSQVKIRYALIVDT